MVLSGGEVYAQGKPEEITTKEMLRDIYHVDADVVEDRDGLPHVIAYGSLDEGGRA